MATIKGTGKIVTADYANVKFTGKTKDGQAIKITLKNAINLEDIDLSIKEKDEVVAKLTFTGCYTNTDATQSDSNLDEPWEIEYTAAESGTASGTIMLGTGVFSIGDTDVALCRGGGEFKTGRTYRKITADGDRGYVKDRIVMDGSEPTLTMNVLTFLGNMSSMFPGIG